VKPVSPEELRSSFKEIVLAVIVLIWITAVVGLYYVGHKPFTSSFTLNIVRALFQLLVASWVISASGGLGLRLIRKYCAQPMVRLAIPAALGIGITSLTVFIFGSLLGMRPLYGWVLLIIITLILRRDIALWLSYWRDLTAIWRKSGRSGKSFAIGVFVILFSTLIMSLSPPLKFDALVYHLTLPKIYLNEGRFIYVPEIMFWGMPQLGESYYTWSFSLAGVEAAAVTGWLIGFLALIGLAGYVAKVFRQGTAWVAIASLLIGSTAALSLSWAYVDWFVVLFGFCVFYMLDCWRLEKHRTYLILSGTFTGLALGVKYTAGVLLLSGILVVIISGLRSRTRVTDLGKDMIAILSPAIFISLPWWIKNVIGAGNPFYPFFIPSGAMTEFRQALYVLPPTGNLLDALLLPWNATLSGTEGAPGFSASIGPLFLGLGVLIWIGWSGFGRRQKFTISTALLMGVTCLLVWIIAAQFSEYLIQSRLYFAMFPVFAVLAGVGFQALGQIKVPNIRLQMVVGIFVLVLFWFSVVDVVVTTLSRGALQVLFDINTSQDYLENNLGWYAPAVESVSDLPSSARVVMLWEPRSYDCVPKCDPDEILDRWLFELEKNGTADIILGQWREAGYTHLLFNRFGADFVKQNDQRYRPDDWEALENLISMLPSPVDFGGSYYLYSIEP
jgi:hypothetical protein